jgi:exosome complex exonuclease DIS3/RRP44
MGSRPNGSPGDDESDHEMSDDEESVISHGADSDIMLEEPTAMEGANHGFVGASSASRYGRPAFFRTVGGGGIGRRIKASGKSGVGRIVKTVSERYVRDDLGFGCYFADPSVGPDRRRDKEAAIIGEPRVIESIDKLLSLLKPSSFQLEGAESTHLKGPTEVVVCDTNVLIHNSDVLEKASALGVLPNIVVPQTALVECRAQRQVAYDRTVDLLRSLTSSRSSRRCGIYFPDPYHAETTVSGSSLGTTSINDENDDRIRKVAAFFGRNLVANNIQVILCTDDAASRELARQEQSERDGASTYRAWSVRQYVQKLEARFPDLSLSDHVAQYSAVPALPGSSRDITPPAASFFPEHVDASIMSKGLRTGKYYRGIYRAPRSGGTCSANNPASLSVRRGDERVIVSIISFTDANRAVDGDVVAVELNPVSDWLPSSLAKAQEPPAKSGIPKRDSDTDSGREAAGIAADTAEPSEQELSNVPESFSVAIDGSAMERRPTGRVVGIVRRSFRVQSGSVWTSNVKAEASETEGDSSSPRDVERQRISGQFECTHADGSSTCVFFPVDTRIPPVLIRTTQRNRLLAQRIVVALDAWPVESPYPLGHYVRTIGPTGSKDVETEVLLQEFDIPHEPFPASVLACLPPEDYNISADNSPGRVDLRHLPILSIDPPNCKDIDDALHCIELPNGNFQVGCVSVSLFRVHCLSV